MLPGARTFGVLSIVGLVVGISTVIIGGETFPMIGVVSIILSAVCLLLATGIYLDSADPLTTD